MLNFFRKNDPYRILALVLILVFTRILFALFIGERPMSSPGEDMLSINLQGNGPIGSWILGMILALPFAKVSSITIAGVLVLLNAVQLNSLLIRNSSLSENTYIPSAFFVFLMSCSADFYYFSPALLASSFVIFSLNYLFYHIKYRGTEENIISTGFGIGVAGLIYTPFLWLYLFILIAYLIYSNTIRRRYFLMTWGFLLPIIMYWVFFFWNDRGTEAINFLGNQLAALQTIQVSPQKVGYTLGFGLLLGLMGFGRSFGSQGKTNHQILVQRAMAWNAFFAIIIAAFYAGEILENEILIIPSLTYFATQLVLNIERKWLREGIFSLCLILALLSVYLGY